VPLLVRTAEGCGGFDWDDSAFARAYEEIEGSLYGDGLADVVAREEPVGVRLDEAAHERAVLVQRRAAVRPVLLEGEREVGAVEGRERAEAETAKRVVEVRRTHGASLYALGSLPPFWQPGHQYAIRAASPCGSERIAAPQRLQARPTLR